MGELIKADQGFFLIKNTGNETDYFISVGQAERCKKDAQVAAIQIAKLTGCRVITTSSTEEKCRRALDLGADVAVNYREKDIVEEVKNLNSFCSPITMTPYFSMAIVSPACAGATHRMSTIRIRTSPSGADCPQGPFTGPANMYRIECASSGLPKKLRMHAGLLFRSSFFFKEHEPLARVFSNAKEV